MLQTAASGKAVRYEEWLNDHTTPQRRGLGTTVAIDEESQNLLFQMGDEIIAIGLTDEQMAVIGGNAPVVYRKA